MKSGGSKGVVSCVVCASLVWAFALVSHAVAEATNKPSDPKAQATLLLIAELFEPGKTETYDRTISSLQSLRTEHSGTLEAELAYVEILRIRWRKGEQEAVLDEYRGWLSGQPSPIAQGHALAYFAEHASASGEHGRGESLYKEAMALAGNHIVSAFAALGLAKVYLQGMGRASDAFALYKQTAEKFRGTPIEGEVRRQWAKALSYYAGQKFPQPSEEQRAVLDPTLQSTADPASIAHARYNLAEVLLALSRPAEALPVLERAAPYLDRYRDKPWAANCLSLLIMLQRQFERWSDAIASARRYVELFPDLPRAHFAQFEIGEFLQKQGRWDDAISEYRRLAERWPTSELVAHAQARISACEQSKSKAGSAQQ